MFDKKIQYFIITVEEGSFSAAARKLYLSQANLSKQITHLEMELGVTLFDRSGYRPVLTDAGEYFYKKIVQLKKQADEIYESLRRDLNRNIRVGFTGAFENREIIEVIRNFQAEYPKMDVSLKRYDFKGCVNALLSGQLDVSFGLESTFRKYKKIEYDVLHGYDICLICAHNHPFARLDSVNVEHIKSEKMIILSKKFDADFYQDFMEACRQDGYVPKIKKEVDTFDELVFSVSIGEGVAITSSSVVRENEVRAVPIDGTHHASNYVIAYLEKHKNDNFDMFVNYIKTYFKTL